MKQLRILCALAISLLVLAGCEGCSSTPQAGGAAPKIDPQEAAVVLKGLANDAAIVAISEHQENRQYVQLAVTTFETFVTGTDYSPGALATALEPVLKEAKDVKVKLAINAVAAFYEISYRRQVQSKLASNETAVLLINALHDGAKAALDSTR